MPYVIQTREISKYVYWCEDRWGRVGWGDFLYEAKRFNTEFDAQVYIDQQKLRWSSPIVMPIEENAMSDSDRERAAYHEGEEAVRQKPINAPENPYDAYDEPELCEAWDRGADSAGISDIYTNGILKKSER